MTTAPSRAQEAVPVNPLLSAHSSWFDPVHIYDLQKEHFPLPDGDYPKGLSYEVFSAVGYDLANTIVIRGPARPDGRSRISTSYSAP